MEIRPIRSTTDYHDTLHRVEDLWEAESGTADSDELDVLVTLLESYEREHYPIEVPHPIDAIKFRLEQEGKGYDALIGIIGQRTRVYEVMRGDSPLSLNMIRKLHAKLEIPAEVLIQPSRLSKVRGKKHAGSTVRSRKTGAIRRPA